jgi:asparagine synthase (glutamine-hydrolysing)
VLSSSLAGQRRIGLTLSGGLDSGVLLALARRVRPDLEIATYTIGYGEDDREILGAREAARHFATEHHEHFFDLAELPALLPGFVWLTEDPMGREETLLQQVITRVAALRDRVLVCGNGADMDFCGMPRHRLLWLRDRAPWPLRGPLDELFRYTQMKLEPRSWLGRALVKRVYGADRPAPPTVRGAAPPALDVDYRSLAAYQCDTTGIKSFGYHEAVDAQLGVRLIAPFSSPEIFDFALGCPIAHLIDLRTQKRLLRAAVADLLPPALSARGKAIQRLRHDRELSDRLDEVAGSLDLDAALASRGLLPPEYVRRLRARAAGAAYTTERLHTLWALICAELWLRQFVDDRGRPIPGFGDEIVVCAA